MKDQTKLIEIIDANDIKPGLMFCDNNHSMTRTSRYASNPNFYRIEKIEDDICTCTCFSNDGGFKSESTIQLTISNILYGKKYKQYHSFQIKNYN